MGPAGPGSPETPSGPVGPSGPSGPSGPESPSGPGTPKPQGTFQDLSATEDMLRTSWSQYNCAPCKCKYSKPALVHFVHYTHPLEYLHLNMQSASTVQLF